MNILALKRLGYGIWMILLSMFFSLETVAFFLLKDMLH